ncbi:hypothetical protein CY35_06G074700 [Sphagnum magellanicum]|nr:hypothetical protein CY35_06G074700 [Sphagnum magellanicum]KAH9559812.1 hypothetical protein CY35_06G074700 [Sphagnum magellanicum]
MSILFLACANTGSVSKKLETFEVHDHTVLKEITQQSNLISTICENPIMSIKKGGQFPPETLKLTKPDRGFLISSRYATPQIVNTSRNLFAASSHEPVDIRGTCNQVKGKRSIRPEQRTLSGLKPSHVSASRNTRASKVAATTAAGEQKTGGKIGRFTKSLSSASSLLEKSLQKQPQDTQFVSVKSGARSPLVESLVQTFVPPQAKISGNLLRSATHWLYLVELALAEKLHNVAVDLFRLAISCRAQPLEHIAMNLRLYWEAHAVGDDSIGYLLQQCRDLGCELATPPCHILVNEVTDRNRLDSSLCFSAGQFSNDLRVGKTGKDVIGSADDDTTTVMTGTPTMANTSDKSHYEIQLVIPVESASSPETRDQIEAIPAVEDQEETASIESAVSGTVRNLYEVNYGHISSQGSNHESIQAAGIREPHMLEADDKACFVEAEVFLKDPITSTLPGCHDQVIPPVNLESLYQAGDSTGIAVGSLSDWLANESEGDAADSQILSIDVLALSSKGEDVVSCMPKEGEGDGEWPIIHEDGKLSVETISCPLASDIYVRKMTTEMATDLSNEICDNMGANSERKGPMHSERELSVASKSSSSVSEGWDTVGQLLEAPSSVQQKLANSNVLPCEIHDSQSASAIKTPLSDSVAEEQQITENPGQKSLPLSEEQTEILDLRADSEGSKDSTGQGHEMKSSTPEMRVSMRQQAKKGVRFADNPMVIPSTSPCTSFTLKLAVLKSAKSMKVRHRKGSVCKSTTSGVDALLLKDLKPMSRKVKENVAIHMHPTTESKVKCFVNGRRQLTPRFKVATRCFEMEEKGTMTKEPGSMMTQVNSGSSNGITLWAMELGEEQRGLVTCAPTSTRSIQPFTDKDEDCVPNIRNKTSCSTPGSKGLRRSARLQKKVQSRLPS